MTDHYEFVTGGADGRPVAMHDLIHLYADQRSEEHPQADGPDQARDRRAAHYLDITGAALRPRATARKGQGSSQEDGQHQERCQIVAPLSTMTGPPTRASRSLAPVPAGTRKGAACHGRERTVRKGPSSAAGCPWR